MGIPAHIAAALGCPPEIDREAFDAHLESVSTSRLPWFLADRDAREVLTSCLFDERAALEKVAIIEVLYVRGFVYYSATSDGNELRSLLAFPDSAFSVADVPTAALAALARLWPTWQALVVSEEDAGEGGEVVDPTGRGGEGEVWAPSKLRGKVLVLSPREQQLMKVEEIDLNNVLIALAGIQRETLAKKVGPPAWVAKSSANLGGQSLALRNEMMAGRLLQEALGETRPRWRFIALYRILEAAYLVALKDAFARDFLRAPKVAVERVQGALGSEQKQFDQLVVQHDLIANFDEIRVVIEGLPANNFASAIKKRVDEPLAREAGAKRWRLGVGYTYQIRCSIVHAGQRDVVFDRYEDGDDALVALLPSLERAVFALLGVDLP